MSDAPTLVSVDDDVVSVGEFPQTCAFFQSSRDKLTNVLIESAPQNAATARVTKRNRARSSLVSGEPAVSFYFTNHSIYLSSEPRESTPAESEVGTISSGVSEVAPSMTGQQRRNKTKLRRLNAPDPESELGKYFLWPFKVLELTLV